MVMPIAPHAEPALAAETIATVERWLEVSRDVAADPSAARLAGVLKDPVGLEFTLGFVDRVVRPEDLRVAAHNLSIVAKHVPTFLPWYLRAAIIVGGGFATLLPWVIVPIARWVFRGMVGHLIADARPERLRKAIRTLRRPGIRLNLNLLGEAVLGDDEADRRLAGTRDLLARDDVDYVSIKVSSVSSQLSMWAFTETVERVVERLLPLYTLAAQSKTPKFINLDMEEFRDLDLTVAVFTTLLEKRELQHLEAGIVLQAYLPDALAAYQGLTKWALARRKAGGAGIKVRLVKGANLAMERVDAAIHGWPLATFDSKQATDTNYKRVLDWALTPERTDAVRLGVAGHNLFDIAHAWLLAKERHVASRLDFEMLLGMATGQAEAVKQDVGSLLLYTPVVKPSDFDSAISYLVRRLEENASSENFMSAVFDLDDPALFARERDRFLASLAAVDSTVPASKRRQDRAVSVPAGSLVFANEPDTDTAIGVNRAWGLSILKRSQKSRLGAGTVADSAITSSSAIEKLVVDTVTAGVAWGARPAIERTRLLVDAGDVLAAFRGRLIEVMMSETGKTIAEADVEVSEAVDFARYYGARAPELEGVHGARFVPSRLTVVTPPWNFPVAIPAGSVLAALAAGSAVIIKPAPQSKRSAAVMVEALWEAGIPRDVLRFADVEEGDLGKQLIAHPAVDRVILTGGWETARLFRSWRADLPLLAETSGKNAIIVTPAADLDLAVADVVKSAFGHAGQKCSAASLVILVGSVARSERFRRQLVDAVSTVRVGEPHKPLTQMGPLIEAPHGKLLTALTTLDEGEGWLVEPRAISEKLWTPGVKTGIAPGSAFHRTEYFGPVLGIMEATSLDEAIALQNATDFGLTAGIHSLDPIEVERWLDTVQAGNLYVNRGITGAVVQRQPFGGWKRSVVGAGAKAGGPNYLMTLGRWEPVDVAESDDLRLDGLDENIASIIKKSQQAIDFAEFGWVRDAALDDEAAWRGFYASGRDVSALGVERNVLRYRPLDVTLRLSEGESLAPLVRVLAAASRAGARVTISSALSLPAALMSAITNVLPPVRVRSVRIESDEQWLASAAEGAIVTSRVRLIGGDPLALAEALGGDPDVAIYADPITTSGRVELLPFLHEQAVSITAHRFGNPDAGMIGVRV
jgi:RHH-type transcriptional regulator, proline utilization regulon repressor / proline dehydrogenase / delta 1-pyrroline-5-carboxylate dehydrogenase